jgi:membrane protease YdiL (CAAX protease family)
MAWIGRTAQGPLALGGLALLVVGAFVPDLRPTSAALGVVGWAVLAGTRRPEALGWAATVPVALILAWPWVLGADQPLGPGPCAEPLAVIALRRLVVVVAVLAAIAILGRVHRSSLAAIGFGRPPRLDTWLAPTGLVVLAVSGLVVGPWIAAPFFGRLEFERPIAAIVPAVVFGVANGTAEELAYRGALQTWLGRATRPWLALAAQALVFGVVHVGPEVTAFVPVHVALLTLVGVAAGLYVRWRGSVWLPIGVHIGADIALYFGLACRAAS